MREKSRRGGQREKAIQRTIWSGMWVVVGFRPLGESGGASDRRGLGAYAAVTHDASTPRGTLRTYRCPQDRKYRSQFHHPMEPIISKLARSYVDADDLDRQLRRLFQARRFRCRRDAAAGAPRPLRRMRDVRPGHISAATRRRRRGRPAGPRRGPQRYWPCFPTIFSHSGG